MMARRCARLVLAGIVALGAMAPAGSSFAQQRERFVLLGACYCRTAGTLHCLGELTGAECRRRCADQLCDDWFWLERRPCWNWGYGG
jgi:hypothetical protein